MTAEEIVLRADGDGAALEVHCTGCSAHLCDAQDGDTLAVLLRVAADHTCTATDEQCEEGEDAEERFQDHYLRGGMTVTEWHATPTPDLREQVGTWLATRFGIPVQRTDIDDLFGVLAEREASR
jgi:hypothetical protein